MTALTKYERLETTGLWRPTPEEQRREVLLSFGKTSLVIRDKTSSPITHWSLSAIQRFNPGEHPAIFGPGLDMGESLEIEDDIMIDAIEKVRKAITRRQPHRGRLRLSVLTASIIGVIAICLFWLPNTLTNHALSVVPNSKRLDIGNRLLGEMTRLSGRVCVGPLGRTALEKLRAQLDSNQRLERLAILPTDARNMVLLPGQILTLSQTLVEDFDTSDVVAGYILAGIETAKEGDPLKPLLVASGIRATFQLLTTGEIDQSALRIYSEKIMRENDTFPEDAALLPAFEAANISTQPFAYARDFSGETVLGLIEADHFRTGTPKALLSDGEWISLQAVCDG
ncbi:MAG: hypothetical protein ABJ327_20645 [Litoreibacter sp.]